MKKTAIVLAVLTVFACGTGALLAQGPEDAKFKKFQDTFWDAYFKFYPTAGTVQGFTKYNDKLEDPSEGALDKFGAKIPHQFNHRRYGPPGSQQIVSHHHPVTGFESVLMDLQGIDAIFQLVTFLMGFIGKFPRFPDQGDARSKLVGQGRAENETTRFNADNLIDFFTDVAMGDEIDHPMKTFRVGQKGCDVFENDAFFGEIRDVANDFFQVFHVADSLMRKRIHSSACAKRPDAW